MQLSLTFALLLPTLSLSFIPTSRLSSPLKAPPKTPTTQLLLDPSLLIAVDGGSATQFAFLAGGVAAVAFVSNTVTEKVRRKQTAAGIEQKPLPPTPALAPTPPTPSPEEVAKAAAVSKIAAIGVAASVKKLDDAESRAKATAAAAVYESDLAAAKDLAAKLAGGKTAPQPSDEASLALPIVVVDEDAVPMKKRNKVVVGAAVVYAVVRMVRLFFSLI